MRIIQDGFQTMLKHTTRAGSKEVEMGSARVERRSRKRIGRRAGIIVAMLAAVVLLMGFAGMAVAETASDDGAQSVEKVNVNVKAKWADDNDADGVRPSSVKVQLMADGKIAKDAKDKPIIIELAASKDWKSTVKDLDKTKDGKAIKYTLAPKAIDKYEGKVKELEAGKDSLNFEVTFTHEPAPAAVDDKVADDAAAKDEAKSDEAPAAAAPAASDDKADGKTDGEADFTPQADDDDDAGDAKADETPAADDGDDAKADDDQQGGFAPAADEDIKVTKKWVGDEEANRPDSITVTLLVDDESKDTAELTADNGWEGFFSYTPDTQDSKFEVQEVEVEGYKSEVSGDVNEGFIITNTYEAPEPEKIDIEVTKKWDDSNDADGLRPESVTVTLDANGDSPVEAELDASGEWTYTFKGLDKMDGEDAIEYTVEEDAVDGYTSKVSGDAESGFTITNTHQVKKEEGKKDDGKKKDTAKKETKPIPTTSITATKVWKDKDNIKKTRENVTLYLVQKVGDGKWTTVSGSNRAIAATAAGDGLKVTWTGLPTEDKNGNKIEYCVAEQWTKNYTSKVTGDVKSGFTVTNTLGRVPKTGDTNAGGAAAAVVLVIAAAGVFAATRRTRKE